MEEKKLTGYPSIDKPWLKYYSEEEKTACLPACTMYEYVLNRNQDNMSSTAINYYGSNITYGQLFRQIDTVASALENIGVQSGDIVTVCMINSPEVVGLIFALNKIGATANMVFGASPVEEIREQVQQAGSKIVFTLDVFQEKFLQIFDDTSVETIVVCGMTQAMSVPMQIGARLFKGMKRILLPNDKRFLSWKHFLKKSNGISVNVSNADAPAVITYTGGTTGGSKGVLLSNKAILAVAHQYILSEKSLKRESTWAQLLPLFIAYGITCSLLIPLAVGMKLIVRLPMSEPLVEVCKKFKPNHIIYGPAYWEALADTRDKLDLSYLNAPISGGDKLHSATEEKINHYLAESGCTYPIMNGYGMTEVGAAVSVNMTGMYKAGSVGIPFVQNTISAFDVDTCKELPYGEEGEICICTPSTMLGYLNNPEETANILRRHEDGLLWIHSGDLGHIDEDGFVHINGRLKRYMLRIGDGLHKKVFALYIEKIVLQHPKVRNCVVVPMNDIQEHQVPVAFILPEKNIESTDSLMNEISAYCKKELDKYHRPAKYYFIDKVPLTKVGKVDYRSLEKLAEQRKNG